jgi:hypothetical protein
MAQLPGTQSEGGLLQAMLTMVAGNSATMGLRARHVHVHSSSSWVSAPEALAPRHCTTLPAAEHPACLTGRL